MVNLFYVLRFCLFPEWENSNPYFFNPAFVIVPVKVIFQIENIGVLFTETVFQV